MPASDRAIRRIRKELKLLWIDPPAFCRPGPAPVTDPFHWEVVIDGPDGTFPVGVAYPKDYPFKPIKLTFKTKVYHPNIGPEGRMALDVFGSEWRPSLHDKHGPPVRRLRPLRPPARPPRPPRRRPAVQARAWSLRAEGQGLDPQVRLGAGRLLLSGMGGDVRRGGGGGGGWRGGSTSPFLRGRAMVLLRGSSPMHPAMTALHHVPRSSPKKSTIKFTRRIPDPYILHRVCCLDYMSCFVIHGTCWLCAVPCTVFLRMFVGFDWQVAVVTLFFSFVLRASHHRMRTHGNARECAAN